MFLVENAGKIRTGRMKIPQNQSPPETTREAQRANKSFNEKATKI
jgi:hypothetical protein